MTVSYPIGDYQQALNNLTTDQGYSEEQLAPWKGRLVVQHAPRVGLFCFTNDPEGNPIVDEMKRIDFLRRLDPTLRPPR